MPPQPTTKILGRTSRASSAQWPLMTGATRTVYTILSRDWVLSRGIEELSR